MLLFCIYFKCIEGTILYKCGEGCHLLPQLETIWHDSVQCFDIFKKYDLWKCLFVELLCFQKYPVCIKKEIELYGGNMNFLKRRNISKKFVDFSLSFPHICEFWAAILLMCVISLFSSISSIFCFDMHILESYLNFSEKRRHT